MAQASNHIKQDNIQVGCVPPHFCGSGREGSLPLARGRVSASSEEWEGLPRGWGGALYRGGGVMTLPLPFVDRQTPLKKFPFRNFVGGW